MGAVTPAPLPTYPDGFPPEIVARLERATGQVFCCNKPGSGTAVIDDFGERHLQTGELILYTSADSVLQIAAHEDVVPEVELHDLCAQIRTVMVGPDAVGRGHRSPLHRNARPLRAHHRPQGLLGRPAVTDLPSTSCKQTAWPSTRSARCATSSPATEIDQARKGETNTQALRRPARCWPSSATA